MKIMSPATTSVRGFVSRSGCKKGPVSNVDLTIVLLRAESDKIEDIVPLVDEIKAARPGVLVWVSGG